MVSGTNGHEGWSVLATTDGVGCATTTTIFAQIWFPIVSPTLEGGTLQSRGGRGAGIRGQFSNPTLNPTGSAVEGREGSPVRGVNVLGGCWRGLFYGTPPHPLRGAGGESFVAPTEMNAHRDALRFLIMGPSLLPRVAVGGWQRLAVGGGWRLVVPGGGP